MIAGGFGTSVIPALAVDVERKRADMSIRPFDLSDIGRTLRLIYPPHHPQVAVLRELRDILQGVLSQP